MFTQNMPHFRLLRAGQMPVFNKDRERGMFDKIDSLQNLVIMPFRVDL